MKRARAIMNGTKLFSIIMVIVLSMTIEICRLIDQKDIQELYASDNMPDVVV